MFLFYLANLRGLAVCHMVNKNLKDIRKTLTDRCNRVLLMYRRHCAPAVQSGQASFCLQAFSTLLKYAFSLLAHPPGRLQTSSALYPLHAEIEGIERYSGNLYHAF